MARFHIVRTPVGNESQWQAHQDGLLARLGIFNSHTAVPATLTRISADDCEGLLRRSIVYRNQHPEYVVRVVEIEHA